MIGALLAIVSIAWASGIRPSASAGYDAVGRRVTASLAPPLGGVAATRYYYDGRREIEERDGIAAGEPLMRYHVNGGQFIDERVATYSAATGEFTYYLAGDLYSVIGTGNASASDIRRLEYAASGDVIGCLRADANCDGLVNNFDIDPFVAILVSTGCR